MQYKNVIYQITDDVRSMGIRGAEITIIETLDGKIYLEHKGRPISYKLLAEQEYIGSIVNTKELERFLREKKERKVPENHPWKQRGRAKPRDRKKQLIGI